MIKERYERTELELIKFTATDVITTSGDNPDGLPIGGAVSLPTIR